MKQLQTRNRFEFFFGRAGQFALIPALILILSGIANAENSMHIYVQPLSNKGPDTLCTLSPNNDIEFDPASMNPTPRALLKNDPITIYFGANESNCSNREAEVKFRWVSDPKDQSNTNWQVLLPRQKYGSQCTKDPNNPATYNRITNLSAARSAPFNLTGPIYYLQVFAYGKICTNYYPNHQNNYSVTKTYQFSRQDPNPPPLSVDRPEGTYARTAATPFQITFTAKDDQSSPSQVALTAFYYRCSLDNPSCTPTSFSSITGDLNASDIEARYSQTTTDKKLEVRFKQDYVWYIQAYAKDAEDNQSYLPSASSYLKYTVEELRVETNPDASGIWQNFTTLTMNALPSSAQDRMMVARFAWDTPAASETSGTHWTSDPTPPLPNPLSRILTSSELKQGSHALTTFLKDQIGNTRPQSFAYNIDFENPVVQSANATVSPPSSGWYNSTSNPLQIDVNVTDNASGVRKLRLRWYQGNTSPACDSMFDKPDPNTDEYPPPPDTTSDPGPGAPGQPPFTWRIKPYTYKEGSWKLAACAEDLVPSQRGYQAFSTVFKRDTKPPAIQATTSPDPTGPYTRPQTLTITATDQPSGDSTPDDVSQIKSLTVTITDPLGRTTTDTPPCPASSCSGAYRLNQTKPDGTGSYTVTATATDKAGNSTSQTTRYSLDFSLYRLHDFTAKAKDIKSVEYSWQNPASLPTRYRLYWLDTLCDPNILSTCRALTNFLPPAPASQNNLVTIDYSTVQGTTGRTENANIPTNVFLAVCLTDVAQDPNCNDQLPAYPDRCLATSYSATFTNRQPPGVLYTYAQAIDPADPSIQFNPRTHNSATVTWSTASNPRKSSTHIGTDYTLYLCNRTDKDCSIKTNWAVPQAAPPLPLTPTADNAVPPTTTLSSLTPNTHYGLCISAFNGNTLEFKMPDPSCP